MKIITRLAQGTPEWLAWRRDGIGGSDAATILGVAPFEDATRANLIREKIDGWEKERNFAMRRGTRLEPTARVAYQRWASCDASPACVEHEQAPWMRVSLDGLCSNHARIPSERVHWILELKAPNWESHSIALAGVVPAYYRPQCQWQLLVTGLDRLDYASYSEHSRYAQKDRLAVIRVEPDAEMQALLLEECGKFWAEVVALRAERAAKRDWSKVEAEFA